MSVYFWVAGSGNWSDAANHWATTSGGTPSANNLPGIEDDVVFDSNSGGAAGFLAYTVTVDSATVNCFNFTANAASGNACTLALGTSNAVLIYGNYVANTVSTRFVYTAGTSTSAGQLKFVGNSTSLTFNHGTGTAPTVPLEVNVTTGTLTTVGATSWGGQIIVTSGNFALASGFSFRCTGFTSNNLNTRSINFTGSGAITVTGATPVNFENSTGLTFTPGTGTMTANAASPTFSGGGVTFGNVTFSSTASGTTTINGDNTFGNLTIANLAAVGTRFVVFNGNQTVTGTLSLCYSLSTTANRRHQVSGTTSTGEGIGTQVTLTVGTMGTLQDVSFRDINAAGASAPWSGTRIGNAGGCANITFTAAKTVYYSSASGGNWTGIVWATTAGGAASGANFPLPQDTANLNNSNLTSGVTVTINGGFWFGNIDASARSNALTIASAANSPFIYGNLNLSSAITTTGTGTYNFAGASGVTQDITTNGTTITPGLQVLGAGTVRLLDACTVGGTLTLTQGTLNLNNNTLTCNTFTSNNDNSRTLAYGTGGITCTATPAANATLFNMQTVTNLTLTGTPSVTFSGNNRAGTAVYRGFLLGAVGTANAHNFTGSAGNDSISFGVTSAPFNDMNFTGHTGNIRFNNSPIVVGNITLGTGQGFDSTTATITIQHSAGTRTLTTNGVPFNCNLNANCSGATFQLGSALTMSGTLANTLTVTRGTFTTTATNYAVTVGTFNSSTNTTRTVTLNGSVITITSADTSWNLTTTTNLTFNANTSNIVFSNTSAAITMQAGSRTYNIVNLPDSLQTFTINSTPTFANLVATNTNPGEKWVIVNNGFTVTNTFTSTGTNARARVMFAAYTTGTAPTARTITAAAESLTDTDFQGITAAGAGSPFTGTRIGNGGDNTNITFTAGKTVYWNQVAGGEYTDNAWATTSGGAVANTNYPLPQDTIIFNNAGLNSGTTITFTSPVWVGNLDMTALTNTTTLDIFNASLVGPRFVGDFKLSSSVTLGSSDPTATYVFRNASTTTAANISTASQVFPANVLFYAPGSSAGSLLGGFMTVTGNVTLAIGSLNLNNQRILSSSFISTTGDTRSIAFGTGNIIVNGNGATVVSMANLTGFTYTGTPDIIANYPGADGTRIIEVGSTAGGSGTTAVNIFVTAGSDTVSINSNSYVRTLSYTSFFGTGSIPGNVFGNLTLASFTTVTSPGNVFLAATSGTQTITTNGVTINSDIYIDAPGANYLLGSALTTGTDRQLIIEGGNLDTQNYAVTTAKFFVPNTTMTGSAILNLGSSTFTVTGHSTLNVGWQIQASLPFTFTLNAGTSTIVMAEPEGATTQNFEGGSLTYYNLRYTGKANSVIAGNNTFNSFEVLDAPITITFTSGTTTTANSFQFNGLPGFPVTIQSSTTGNYNLVNAGSTDVIASYISVSNCNASPSGRFYAVGSTNGVNNTNWIFKDIAVRGNITITGNSIVGLSF